MNEYIKLISDTGMLMTQADALRKKKFTPGFDGMTAERAYMWFGINAEAVSKDLLKGKYSPMPVIGFCIAKKNVGYRRFVKTTAIDAIVQNSILNVLNEKTEHLFSQYSHAYRNGRGIATALEQYCLFAEVYPYAAKIDPVSFFDNIDRAILKKYVDDFFEDHKITELIFSFIDVPILNDGVFEYPNKGIFQGSPISNMLANIYFHYLDIFLEKNKIPFVRYADDIVLFAKSPTQINAHQLAVSTFIKANLNLQLNKKKSKIDSSLNMIFLEHRFENNKGVVMAIENNVNEVTAYNNWYEVAPFNFRNTVDILSNGILRQKDYSLIFESDNETSDIPVRNIETINIFSSVSFDCRFLNKVFENNIIVNVFDNTNKLIGRFIPNTPLKSPRITNTQIQCYYDPDKRLKFAKAFVLASVHNTRLNIRYHNKQNPTDVYEKALNKIDIIEKQIQNCNEHEKLLLLEAQIRESYYSCFDDFIKNEAFFFGKRTRRPPTNEINAMISFGNTVLYNLLATEIYRSPLDIRVGFLHATNNRKESLNLDLAEIFKPLLVDRVVFTLVNLHSITPLHFSTVETGGIYLNETGKRIFLRAFYEKLNTVITVKDTKQSYRRIIKNEIRLLVSSLKNDEKYTGFRQVR